MSETKIYIRGVELKNVSPLIIPLETNRMTLRVLESIETIELYTGLSIKSIEFKRRTYDQADDK